MDAKPLSALDFRRLKARSGQHSPLSAFQRVAAEWRRPSVSWRQTGRWTWVAMRDLVSNSQATIPALLRGEFVFTLGLWVAVFSVTASIVAMPTIPLPVRYSAGLAAVAYLYLYAELARARRPIVGRRVLLGVADVAVVATLGALSAPYVGYAHLLLFFAAARVAARFRDARILPAGLLLLLPFDVTGHESFMFIVFDAFGVLMTMLLILHLTAAADGAQRAIRRQSALATLVSALAHAGDEETLLDHLTGLASVLVPGCAWAFWLKDPASDDFRAVRWFGLGEERPGPTFTPTLGADGSEAVVITGPLPGTSVGDHTLIQPAVAEGQPYGLITVSGRAADLDDTTGDLVRTAGEELGIALGRLQALDDQRGRIEAMELANRLAGLAAPYACDQVAALSALLPAVADGLRADSLHLEWANGDRIKLVVGTGDPLVDVCPDGLPMAGTRTATVLQLGHPLREPVTGRRPEDIFLYPAGLRHLATVPLRCDDVEGTLQLGRRLARPFAPSEVLLLQLLGDRLAVLFAAGASAVLLDQAEEAVEE